MAPAVTRPHPLHRAPRTARAILARTALAAGVLGLALAAAGCTASPSEPQAVPSLSSSSASAASTAASASAASAASTSASSPASSTAAITLDISIAQGQVSPNGKKLDAKVGDTVAMSVTSDADDKIHAHTGGDGYELEVTAGKTTTGSFTITEPGSIEVESHDLGKTIVILNAR